MNGPYRKIIALLAASSATMLGVTGCAGAGATHPAGAVVSKCAQGANVPPATPTVAVLGQQGTLVDTYRTDFSTVVTGAESMRARMVVSAIGADANAPSGLAKVLLVGEGNNQMERRNNLTCKETRATGTLDTLRRLPEPTKLDEFGALKTLEGNLANTPTANGEHAPIDVVLFSSMADTAGTAAISLANMLDHPAETLNTLAAQQMLPDCTGWRVYAVGGGQQTNAVMDNAAIAKLREFWREYFARCGGKLVAWSAHLERFPTDSDAIAAANTAQVPISRSTNAVVATLAGDVTFDDGKADLRPAASAEFDQLLPLTQEGSGPIAIDGYTDIDSGEGPAWLQDLSNRRAAAVLEWLAYHGVDRSRLTSQGHGARDLVYPNPVTPAQHQANRRVVVTVWAN